MNLLLALKKETIIDMIVRSHKMIDINFDKGFLQGIVTMTMDSKAENYFTMEIC